MSKYGFDQTARAGLLRFGKNDLACIEVAAKRAGLAVVQGDLGHCRSVHDMLSTLGHVLAFPSWYGANLDALFDCLTDPDWHHGHGMVLILKGLQHVLGEAPSEYAALSGALSAAIDDRRRRDAPLWVLVDAALPDTPLIGAA